LAPDGRYCPEGQKQFYQMHSTPQNRNIPNRKRSATVTAAETSTDPRQPIRFEKKKNMLRAPEPI
jgi:hypothetical protein